MLIPPLPGLVVEVEEGVEVRAGVDLNIAPAAALALVSMIVFGEKMRKVGVEAGLGAVFRDKE